MNAPAMTLIVKIFVIANLRHDGDLFCFSHMLLPLLIGQRVDIFPHRGFVCTSTLNDLSIKDILAFQPWLAVEMTGFLYVP